MYTVQKASIRPYTSILLRRPVEILYLILATVVRATESVGARGGHRGRGAATGGAMPPRPPLGLKEERVAAPCTRSPGQGRGY